MFTRILVIILLLRVLALPTHNKNKVTYGLAYYPNVTVMVASYNEEEVIEKRIRNLLELSYPKDKLEILIGSDGSNDKTVEIAKRFEQQGVVVLDFKENRGRADVHNDLIRVSRGSISVFTDADTLFDISFLENIVKPFSNPKIGVVVGRMSYNIASGAIPENEGYYWKYELKIKELENELGILNNGCGACMAIRKELFKPLSPVDDVDTATVIDIILQGYKVVYAASALACDIPPHSAKSELKMRIRGTSKTLSSIGRRTTLFGWCKHPVLIWSLFSHRLLRYFTAYFMLMAFVSNALIIHKGVYYQMLCSMQVLFYFSAAMGLIGDRVKIKIPIASSTFSFCVAMAGMMIGVAKAVTGRVTVTYETDDSFEGSLS